MEAKRVSSVIITSCILRIHQSKWCGEVTPKSPFPRSIYTEKNIYSCKWYVSLWNQILKSWRKLKIRQKTDDWLLLWPFFILFALQLRVCQQESRASWSHRCSDAAEAGGESGWCHALELTLIVEKGDKLTWSGVFSVWERGVIMESVKYIMWEGVL